MKSACFKRFLQFSGLLVLVGVAVGCPNEPALFTLSQTTDTDGNTTVIGELVPFSNGSPVDSFVAIGAVIATNDGQESVQSVGFRLWNAQEADGLTTTPSVSWVIPPIVGQDRFYADVIAWGGPLGGNLPVNDDAVVILPAFETETEAEIPGLDTLLATYSVVEGLPSVVEPDFGVPDPDDGIPRWGFANVSAAPAQRGPQQQEFLSNLKEVKVVRIGAMGDTTETFDVPLEGNFNVANTPPCNTNGLVAVVAVTKDVALGKNIAFLAKGGWSQDCPQ